MNFKRVKKRVNKSESDLYVCVIPRQIISQLVSYCRVLRLHRHNLGHIGAKKRFFFYIFTELISISMLNDIIKICGKKE